MNRRKGRGWLQLSSKRNKWWTPQKGWKASKTSLWSKGKLGSPRSTPLARDLEENCMMTVVFLLLQVYNLEQHLMGSLIGLSIQVSLSCAVQKPGSNSLANPFMKRPCRNKPKNNRVSIFKAANTNQQITWREYLLNLIVNDGLKKSNLLNFSKFNNPKHCLKLNWFRETKTNYRLINK